MSNEVRTPADSEVMLAQVMQPDDANPSGDVHGGDRLPWVKVDGLDNYDPLNAMVWQVHVYGGAGGAVRSWCRHHGLPLHEFAWRRQYGETGFAEDALYLVRPDGYVAFADQSGSADALQRYFRQREIRNELAGGARQDRQTKPNRVLKLAQVNLFRR